MTTYAVGDIQGCYASLAHALESVNFDQSNDTLLCVGDLVNRGPDSLKVINLLKSLKNQCVTVLGNHDIHLLSMIYGIRIPRHTDTVQDILRSPNIEEIADWVRQQPLVRVNEQDKYVLCHAGIYPWWSKKQTLKHAAEIGTILQNKTNCIKLLKKVYGNTPNKWDKNLSAIHRQRFIMNTFTRMRFCSPNGHLNLIESGYNGKIRKNRLPWFTVPNDSFQQYRIIFGHWSALGFLNTGAHLALDTGCVWGNGLTLVKIPKKPAKLKPIKNKHIYTTPFLTV